MDRLARFRIVGHAVSVQGMSDTLPVTSGDAENVAQSALDRVAIAQEGGLETRGGGRTPKTLRAAFRRVLSDFGPKLLSAILSGEAQDPVFAGNKLIGYRPVDHDVRMRALDLAGKYGLGAKQAPRTIRGSATVRHVVVALPALPVGDGVGDALLASGPVLVQGPPGAGQGQGARATRDEDSILDTSSTP